ncbi:hypothetical protein IAI10_13430 [Clostridium sp. 19966]|uniref:nucleotidyltransferase domain-containing protein n=1 Tax=Clostridium sp. 19966 TaxID=2768166 RepID=UPI0028DFE34E|nr:nucleotidyltransferase domain-containing protein [Clostridium sp. 19966]MDT8717668.1 hypothetical protein [Clostridium sp. 19966]
MSLFTPSKRNEVKNAIIDEAKKTEGIIAIILVGSGAIGFTDEVSDLDFSIVVDSSYPIKEVMKKVKEYICSKWKLLDNMENEKRGLQVYMLDNYLEVDIGYMTFEKISAVRERWLVVYDTSNKVDDIMKQSWEVNKNNHGKKETVNLQQVYSEAAEDIWHFLMHAIVAIKRENYWRAIGEMDVARNNLIELLGYKYSLETKRFRNVDRFPEEIKAVLWKTIPKDFRLEAFKISIYSLIDAIYDEIEDFFKGSSSKIKVTREDVKEYYYDVIKE